MWGVLAALCVTSAAWGQQGASTANAPSTDPQRLQKLEDAVQQLQHENQTLRQELDDLKAPKMSQEVTSAILTNSPIPFVLPGGKESKLYLGGYLQANAEFGDVGAFDGNLPGRTNGVSKTNHAQFDRFKIRRARIGVWGDFTEQFDYKLMGDFEQGDGIAGRTAFSGTDLYINWHQFPEMNIKFGQYDTPFGMEQFDIPDMMILTPERSQVTEALRSERQIGVMFWGKPFATVWPEHKDLLTYYLGVFNGNLRNITVNDNNDFEWMGRIESTPFQGKLLGQPATWSIGGAMYYSGDATNTLVSQVGNLWEQADGSLKPLSVQTRGDQRFGWGVDQRFNWGPYTLQAEYMQTRYRGALTAVPQFTARGYWVLNAYQIIPKTLELVGKWEWFKPDQMPNDDLSTVTGGLNWYPRRHGPGEIAVMLDYLHTWSHFRQDNPSFGKDEFDEFMARVQFAY